jgi:hypothetical protein
VVRKGRHHLLRRHRDVKEKADPVGMAAAAQCVRDREEMIVMDPDQVVRLEDLFKFGREMTRARTELRTNACPVRAGVKFDKHDLRSQPKDGDWYLLMQRNPASLASLPLQI